MLIEEIVNNETHFKVFQEVASSNYNGYTYWVESLTSSGIYNITEGFDSYNSALNFINQKTTHNEKNDY